MTTTGDRIYPFTGIVGTANLKQALLSPPGTATMDHRCRWNHNDGPRVWLSWGAGYQVASTAPSRCGGAGAAGAGAGVPVLRMSVPRVVVPGGVAGGPAARPRRWPGWCSARPPSPPPSPPSPSSPPGRLRAGARVRWGPAGRACPCCLSGAPCSAWRRVLRVDPGLAVDRVHGGAPDPPRNPDPPRSFPGSPCHGHSRPAPGGAARPDGDPARLPVAEP